MHSPIAVRNMAAWAALVLPTLAFACGSDPVPQAPVAATSKPEVPQEPAQPATGEILKDATSSTSPSSSSGTTTSSSKDSEKAKTAEAEKPKDAELSAELDGILAKLQEMSERLTQQDADMYYQKLFQKAENAAGLNEEDATKLQAVTARFIACVNAHPPVVNEWHPRLGSLGSTLYKNSTTFKFTQETFDLLLATSLGFQAARDFAQALQVQRTLFNFVNQSSGVLDIGRELAFRRDYTRALLVNNHYDEAIQGARGSLPVADRAKHGFTYVVLLRTIGMAQAALGRFQEADITFASRPPWTVETVTGFNSQALDFELESSIVKLALGTLNKQQMVTILNAQRTLSNQTGNANYAESREQMLEICSAHTNEAQLARALVQKVVHG